MYIIGSDEWHQKAEDWEEFNESLSLRRIFRV